MNHIYKLFTIILLAGILTACGSNAADQAASADAVISGVYTAVAGTSTAQATAATPTVTALPPATTTATLQPSATQITATPTLQTWITYSQPAATTYWSCAVSSLVKDVTMPDGTILAPGETFIKTWKFKNTGSCSWAADYSLVFVKGDDMLGSDVTLGETVALTKKLDVSVEMTAPDSDGTYTGYWQLADASGNTFGELVYVSIVVSGDAATLTPTASATAAITSTPTNAPTASSTTAPVSTTSVLVASPTATATVPAATGTPIPVTIAPTATATTTATLPANATPTSAPVTPTLVEK